MGPRGRKDRGEETARIAGFPLMVDFGNNRPFFVACVGDGERQTTNSDGLPHNPRKLWL
jgi:hypothetical protein